MLPTVAQHAKNHGISPLKVLGQNFIFDLNLCRKIASSAKITENDIVIEVGPGTAGLTRAILELNPKLLIALEKDDRCNALLKEIQEVYKNLSICQVDALKTSISNLISQHNLPKNTKIKIVANLPYNIATPLIINWFNELENIDSINVMVQREVGERICSEFSLKSYGRLSIISQLLCDAKILFDVSPEAFFPKPKIWSSIVRMIPKENRPSQEVIKLVGKLTHEAFSMRRKMIKTSLKPYLKYCEELELNLELRPENLKITDFLNLAKKLL